MNRKSEALLIAVFFVLGVFSAILYLPIRPPIGGGGEPVAIAQTLVRTRIYGNPFFLTKPTGPTAAIVPGYPLFLALTMTLFGDGEFRRVVAVVTFALHGLHAVLLLLCARRAFGTVRPGVWAALLATVLPVFRFVPAWDCMMTADGLMLFYLILNGGRDGRLAPPRWIGLGLLAGAVLLLNASALLVIVPLLILKCARQSCIRSAFAILATAAVCLLPWVLRNERVLGAGVLKNNFGVALYASNNDCARPGLDQMFDCHQAHHPAGSLVEAQLIVDKGEVAYDHYRRASAVQWARSHPQRFATLTVLRAIAFWLPFPSGGPFHWAVWPVTILSAFGLWRLIRLRSPLGFEAALISLVYPWMYYVVVADTRYRYPIMWLSLLAAGFICDRWWPKLTRPAHGRTKPRAAELFPCGSSAPALRHDP